MLKLAACLRAARSLLKMDIKTAAWAGRVSDRAVTRMEKTAHDEDEPLVARFILLYEDHGLQFHRGDNGEIDGVVAVNPQRLMLSAAGHVNPGESIDELLKELRHVGGLIARRKSVDRTKAQPFDTLELLVPVRVRGLFRDILCEWADTKPPFEIHLRDGKTTPITRKNIDEYI